MSLRALIVASFWAVISVALFSQTSLASEHKTGITGTEIKIGLSAPVSGPVPEWGTGVKNTAMFVFDEVNAKGGIHGRKINVIFEDDACSGATAVAALKKLIDRDKVFALLSGLCASATVASFPVAKESRVPILGPAAMPRVILEPFSKYTFLINIEIQFMGAVDVDFAMDWIKPSKVAIVYQADEYGRGALEGSTWRMKKYGLSPVAVESYERGAADLSAQFLKLKAADPDVTILHAYPPQAAFIIRKAWEAGLRSKFIVDVASADPRLMRELAGKDAVAERVAVLSVVVDPSGIENPLTKSFVERFRKAYPAYAAKPGVPGIPEFHGYSTAMVFVEALRLAGEDIDREKFINSLESIKNFATGGFIPVSFSSTNHRGATGVYFWMYDKDAKVKMFDKVYKVYKVE